MPSSHLIWLDLSFVSSSLGSNFRGLFGTAMSFVNFVLATVCLINIAVLKKTYFLFIPTWIFLWMGSWGTIVTLNGVSSPLLPLTTSTDWFSYLRFVAASFSLEPVSPSLLYGSSSRSTVSQTRCFTPARQFFPWEVEHCDIPPSAPSEPDDELEKGLAPGPRRPPTIRSTSSDGAMFRKLEDKREAREMEEESERRAGLAEAEVRVVQNGGESRAQRLLNSFKHPPTRPLGAGAKSSPSHPPGLLAPPLPLSLGSQDDKSSASSIYIAPSQYSQVTSSVNPTSAAAGGARQEGIFISEAFSADFEPPSSLVEVSIASGSDSENESANASALSPGSSFGGRVERPETEESGGGPSVAGVPSSADLYPLPYPLPVGTTTDEIESTTDAVWPSTIPSSPSVSRAPSQAGETYPPRPPTAPAQITPQLIPHDHSMLKLQTHKMSALPSSETSSSPTMQQRQGRSGNSEFDSPHNNPNPDSKSSHTHAHTHSHPHSHSPRTPTHDWPAFDFDKLPKAPPPTHLTGDRRAIAFTAPMTSVSQCALVVRMHWEVVSEYP